MLVEEILANFRMFVRKQGVFFAKKGLDDGILNDLFNCFEGANVYLPKDMYGRGGAYLYQPQGINKEFFFKKYKRGGLIAFLGSLYIGYQRIFDELNIDITLQKNGIPSPRIFAIYAQKVFPIFYKLGAIFEKIEDATTFFAFLKNTNNTKQVIQSVAKSINKLFSAGIFHTDLNLNNILICGDKVYFIDFDKAKVLEKLTEKHKMKMIARLYRSYIKLTRGKPLLRNVELVYFLKILLSNNVPLIKKYARFALREVKFHQIFYRIKGWR